jgi:hypothetical protein
MAKKSLTSKQQEELLKILKARFEKNMNRHKGIEWSEVESRLKSNPSKMWSIEEMESTEGEPDVVGMDKKSGAIIFFDCAPESPKGRRSLCYDRAALDERKEFKPVNSAIDMATEMGTEILSEEDYRALQKLGKFDQKTSSWIETPASVRKLGGALFADYRYGQVFVYHNGAGSYYAARAFRVKVSV